MGEAGGVATHSVRHRPRLTLLQQLLELPLSRGRTRAEKWGKGERERERREKGESGTRGREGEGERERESESALASSQLCFLTSMTPGRASSITVLVPG